MDRKASTISVHEGETIAKPRALAKARSCLFLPFALYYRQQGLGYGESGTLKTKLPAKGGEKETKMKARMLILLVLSVLLTGCKDGVSSTPTATRTMEPPTATATVLPTEMSAAELIEPDLPTWDKALEQVAGSCREMPELSLNNEEGYVVNPLGVVEYLYYLLDKAGLEKSSQYYWELAITYVPNTSYCWVGLVSYTEDDLTMVFENSGGVVELLAVSPPPSRYEIAQSRSVP